jgi:hypothetical protein
VFEGGICVTGEVGRTKRLVLSLVSSLITVSWGWILVFGREGFDGLIQPGVMRLGGERPCDPSRCSLFTTKASSGHRVGERSTVWPLSLMDLRYLFSCLSHASLILDSAALRPTNLTRSDFVIHKEWRLLISSGSSLMRNFLWSGLMFFYLILTYACGLCLYSRVFDLISMAIPTIPWTFSFVYT